MNTEATIPGLGKTYFDNHRANIMSLYQTTDDHFVEMQSWKRNPFRVQEKRFGVNGEPDWNKPRVEFVASDEGLYALEPTKKFMDAVANHNGDKVQEWKGSTVK